MLGDSAVSVGNFAWVDTAGAACVSRAERYGQRRLPTHGGERELLGKAVLAVATMS
jgi:hypothetical protein